MGECRGRLGLDFEILLYFFFFCFFLFRSKNMINKIKLKLKNHFLFPFSFLFFSYLEHCKLCGRPWKIVEQPRTLACDMVLPAQLLRARRAANASLCQWPCLSVYPLWVIVLFSQAPASFKWLKFSESSTFQRLKIINTKCQESFQIIYEIENTKNKEKFTSN